MSNNFNFRKQYMGKLEQDVAGFGQTRRFEVALFRKSLRAFPELMPMVVDQFSDDIVESLRN